VVGVSSHPLGLQRRVATNTGTKHLLLSDPGMLVARALGVPTFNADGGEWYCRLTLVVTEGRIAQVLYPINDATRGALQAMAWMREQGG